jgi:hypothetical protein
VAGEAVGCGGAGGMPADEPDEPEFPIGGVLSSGRVVTRWRKRL